MDKTDDPAFLIAGRRIGPDEPVYTIAEISANHLGDLGRAVELVRAAAEAGADAVKLQTYTADTMTLDIDDSRFRVGPGTPWAGRSLYDIYTEAHTPWAWHPKLMEVAASCGIHCFSSPFDPTAVAFLDQLGVPAFKIASFELVDVGLIECAAATGKPLIMSTGMASTDEIDDAVAAARRGGAGGLALLQCTSSYPAPPEAANLRAIESLRQRFGTVVGLSDHTLEETVVIAAVALGARVIEKHFTLRRADGGPDGSFSLEPEEFARMVKAARIAERALGGGRLGRVDAEQATSPYRRSLFVVEDVDAGEPFTPKNVRAIRPADGLLPKYLPEILKRRASVAVARGTPLAWDLVEGGAS